MTKNEFIIELRKELSGELPAYEVENNISYYEGYFATSNKTEKEVIGEIGDPRLIAKTIIESYKMSGGIKIAAGSGYSNDNYERERGNNSGWEDQFDEDNKHKGLPLRNVFHLILIILVIGVIIAIGSFIMRILFMLALPVLAVVLIVKLLKSPR